jgi:phosphoribosylaminoimidazolecarboxamide formyltransferase/IMP cyclohydrolase
MTTRRALISVSDKAGIVEFAQALAARGFEIVSTGGTARTLGGAGLAVRAVSAITGVPEMMDGRVKTLHPRIHGGILARRDHPEDLEAAERHGIGLIDLVAVNLYPFAQAAADPARSFEALVEEIDIGGPSLVRAAAKNFLDVLVVVSPADYGAVLAALDSPGGPGPAFRLALARSAFSHTADYDAMIAATLGEVTRGEGGFARRAAGPLPATMLLRLEKARDLRYGENPHQRAAWYGTGGASPRIVQGKELSFTNLLDLDAAWRIAAELTEPAAVVIKHTNPCGAATGAALAEAYTRARDADPLAAFGGIVGLNRPVDVATAQAITSTFIEAVIAPEVEDSALPILAVKKNMRVVLASAHPTGEDRPDLRSMFAGVLVQERDRVTEAAAAWPPPRTENGEGGVRVVTRREPTMEEWAALRFAWRLCAHVKSNAVIFTASDRTLAIGAGQMSRVDAVQVAVLKAASKQGAGARPLAGSVAASDAFFPFRDGLDAVAAAGATAVIQPGGSVRDAEVIAAADEHGLAMVFTHRRHFRH